MNKIKIITLALLTLLAACGTKTSTPDPEPEEYFSFYADGEFFNYRQQFITGLIGDTDNKAIEAERMGTTGYRISASDHDAPGYARGGVQLFFSGAHIPESDTVIIHSGEILDFKSFFNNYVIKPPLFGTIIFTERTTSKLTGTFEFEAYKSLGGGVYSDTILHITGGKFSIIPSN